MKLGNSFGQNKGKKYLRKQDIDLVFPESAEHFNEWFSANSSFIIDYLKNKRYFDVDAFHEGYIKMYEYIFYSGSRIENYKSYFIRSYFTISLTKKMKENRYCEMLPVYEKEDYYDPLYWVEADRLQRELEKDILEYVCSRYSSRDFELFRMYTNLLPEVKYCQLEKITGIKLHNICRIISKIKKDLRSNKNFTERHYEITCGMN